MKYSKNKTQNLRGSLYFGYVHDVAADLHYGREIILSVYKHSLLTTLIPNTLKRKFLFFITLKELPKKKIIHSLSLFLVFY